MRERSLRLWIPALLLAMGSLGKSPEGAIAADVPWKAGTARAAITPKAPMWMSGYAARTKPSEGVVHDLWAKALALQCPSGRRAADHTRCLRNRPRSFDPRS